MSSDTLDSIRNSQDNTAAIAATDATEDDDKKKSSSSNTSSSSTPVIEPKVKVHFVAVGSAPIMKKTKFQIGADQKFASIHAFLRRILRLSGESSLFLYCSSAFVPGPDELLGDLRDCFSVRDELVIHYSLQEAWG